MMPLNDLTISQTSEFSKEKLEMPLEARLEELNRTNQQLRDEVARLKKVEAELNSSRKQLLEIIDFLPDATFVIDNDNRVIAWNRAIEDMSGIKKEEMVGQGDYAYSLPFYGKRRPHLLNLLDVSDVELASKYQNIQRQGTSLCAEVFVPAVKGGVGAYVWVIAAPLYDADGVRIGAIESIRDITRRKQMEDQITQRITSLTSPVTNISDLEFIDLFDLEEIQQIQDAFAKATGVASIITGIDGYPITKPSNFCRLCKDIIRKTEKGLANCYRSDAILGQVNPDGPITQPCLSGGLWDGGASITVGDRHIANWLIGQVLDESCNTEVMMRYARQIGADEMEYRQALNDVTRMSSGQFREVCKALFLIAGQLSRLATWNVQQARYIAERKLAEEERSRLALQLMHAQKLESLGVLAGGIAHDFNNILMAIIGNADLALMRLNKESPVVENLHRIEQSAERAAGLAKQMLAYSGKGKFIVENIDLNCLLQEMQHMLEVSISRKAVLQLNLAQSIPAIEADSSQLRQIVMNLVINASEAIGDRGGVITVTTGCIYCDSSYLNDVWLNENASQGLYVFMEVSDTGCGMDSETLSRIFDPFFTTKFTGRGLGMAAVFGIVRGHKGVIKAFSEPDKGSTFRILLPAVDEAEQVSAPHSFVKQWYGDGTVLLVDDEEEVRTIGSEMLRMLGFSVITADDGRECLDKFKNYPSINFVLLDLTMPNMDGEQCFQELRRIDPKAMVIISSGYNEQEVTQRFAGMGLAGFIQKPYKLSDLKDVIRALTGNSQREHNHGKTD